MASSEYSGDYTRKGDGNRASNFPNPFDEIATFFTPENIRDVFEWCTPAGTLIELDTFGHAAAVETLKVGDKVLTRSGKRDVIDKVSKRIVTEDIVQLQVTGINKGNALRITPEHPVLIYRNPNKTNKASRVDFEQAYHALDYTPAGEVKVGDWVFSPARKYEPTTDFPYDPFLIGLYLAEGCLLKRFLKDGKEHARGVRFTLGTHEAVLIRELVKVLKEYFGDCVTVSSVDTRTNISVFDPEFADYLRTQFGEYSSKKRIHDSVFGLPREHVQRLLGAWINGDGHVVTDHRGLESLSIYSCSNTLILQALRLAESIGLTPSWNFRARDPKGGFNVTTSMEASLIFNKGDIKTLCPHVIKADDTALDTLVPHSRVITTDRGIFRKVSKAKLVQFNDYVYNIRVANEHNYIANGFVVHNCEYIMMNFGTVRSASTKVARYFLTDIELITEESSKEQKAIMEQLKGDMRIMTQLGEVGDNFMTYGNAFVSVNPPFKRMLKCNSCKALVAIAAAPDFKYNSTEVTSSYKCKSKRCKGKTRTGTFQDVAIKDPRKVTIIQWDPKQIVIRHNMVTRHSLYYWDIPDEFVSKVKRGDEFILATTPESILKAIADKDKKTTSNNKGGAGRTLFQFHEDGIYHVKGPSLAGLDLYGWGVPNILANFKQIYYLQTLRRADEAIAQDFIVPFRVISPPAQGGPAATNDPLQNVGGANFLRHAQGMVKRHRTDPTAIQMSPYPLNYQTFGGEGRSLMPKDVIEMATNNLLNDIGYPAELYRGTLSLQAAPVALRVFEQTWSHLVDGYNYLLKWLISTISKHFAWGEVTGRLVPVTLADDIARTQVGLQAAAGMDISKSTAYRAYNIDYIEEQKRVITEQVELQRQQREAQEEASSAEAQAQSVGGGGAPGAPGGPGGQTPAVQTGATPGDLYEQARDTAKQMLTDMPDGVRRSELIKMKQTNPTLHAMVKQELANLRSAASSQGQQQVIEQGGPQ